MTNFPLIRRGKNNEEIYPDAGKNAPQSVKDLVEKFRTLPEEVTSEIPLLYYILGSGTPPYKLSKKLSLYVDESTEGEENCKNCQFVFYGLAKENFICSQISGSIKLAGWCKLWKLGKKE